MSKIPPRFRTALSTIVLAGFSLSLAASLVGCPATEFAERYASTVEGWIGTPFVDPAEPHADPARALGAPDGRTVAIGDGAVLELRFFRPIRNGPGADLQVIEIGPDGARARVALSEDGVRWDELAEPATDAGSTSYDLEAVGLERASWVRIRGLDNLGLDPGFDLDAVEALH